MTGIVDMLLRVSQNEVDVMTTGQSAHHRTVNGSASAQLARPPTERGIGSNENIRLHQCQKVWQKVEVRRQIVVWSRTIFFDNDNRTVRRNELLYRAFVGRLSDQTVLISERREEVTLPDVAGSVLRIWFGEPNQPFRFEP